MVSGLAGAIKNIYINIKSEWNGAGAKKAKKDIKDTKKEAAMFQNTMLGAGLSALFFGMAMRNMALNVWKTTTKTFQEVMHSVEGTVTSFDLLAGSMAYLRFNVGQALEPLAEALIPIVDWLSEIAAQNPRFIQFSVTFAAIAGTFLMIAGQIGTVVAGFSGLASSAGAANGAASVLKGTLGALVATGYIIDMTMEFQEDDIGSGIASALQAAGLIAVIGKKTKTGGTLFAIGAAIEFVDALVEGGGKLTPAAFANWLMQIAPGIFFLSGPVGAAVLTVGVAMKFMSPETQAEIVDVLSYIFGGVVMVIAAILDTIMVPVIAALNTAIGIANAVNFLTGAPKLDYLDYYGLTESAAARVTEIGNRLDMYSALRNTSDTSNQPLPEGYGMSTHVPMSFEIKLDASQTEKLLNAETVLYTAANQSLG